MLDPNISETRDPEYLEPELRKRWEGAFSVYKNMYPNEPEPFLTQTYRSPERQDELYEQGRTTSGNIVTWVKGGHSYHNMLPSIAFDIAFHKPVPDGGPYGRPELFQKFAEIAKKFDIEWGGDWPQNIDMPHFQVPRYSIAEANENKPINWLPFPYEYLPSDIDDSLPFKRIFIVKGDDIDQLHFTKASLVGDKLYIKVFED